MFALGGATYGHEWSEHEFVESHARLDINALHQAGALRDGAETSWAWPNGLKVSLRATYGEIILSVEDREQVIRVDWLPFLNNRYVRPRFLCPDCGRGAYHLHDKAGTFKCRDCCGYDFRSNHRRKHNHARRRIAKLRKQLGAYPDPLSPITPKRHWRRLDYRKLLAELARCERAMHSDIERLLADLDKRAKP